MSKCGNSRILKYENFKVWKIEIFGIQQFRSSKILGFWNSKTQSLKIRKLQKSIILELINSKIL